VDFLRWFGFFAYRQKLLPIVSPKTVTSAYL